VQIDGVAAELIEKIDGLTVDEIIFRKGDYSISVRPLGSSPAMPSVRQSGSPAASAMASSSSPQSTQPAAPLSEPQKEEPEYKASIKAPLVGTFYTAPGPGQPVFVKEGDIVEKGAKVCIVEAMKLFNEISAPTRCRIVKILVENGTAVDKDQPLFGIEEL
jgi:acetyl-CoA carboxylase biotin carboxyl carrier protein